jgi:WD40 repeat protein
MEINLNQDLCYQEYFLLKDNNIYKITINKNDEIITFKCRNYMIDINFNDLYANKFDSIDDAYEFVLSIFEQNNAFIKDIIVNKELKLVFKINEEKEFEILLLYNKINNDLVINQINKLNEEINDLKNENYKLRQEIEYLKKYHYKTNPKEIQLLTDITKDSYSCTNLDNTYNIFKSINNKFYLIYATENKSLICYDLNEQNIIKELKNYHSEYITNLRHYLDERNKRDLIMSISKQDNNIRIWDIRSWECIVNITEANESGYLLSACFLYENNQIYIITSNSNFENNSEPIKIFDFNGNKIKDIKDSNEETYFIDTYYDNILSNNYIITGNKNYVKSYVFNKNELYHKYYDKDNGGHGSIIINSNEEIIKLIDSCDDGNIRIWNFHSGLLLNKIEVTKKCLYGICLWNDNYLFVGCSDKTIKLIELYNGLVIKSLTGHNDVVLTIKKIDHPQYGESLITQGAGDDQIKLWTYKK